MKILFAISAVIALSTWPCFAKILPCPARGAPMFSITIPDDWELVLAEDNSVSAFSPDQKINLFAWELAGKNQMRDLGNNIVNMLKDHATHIRMLGDGVVAHPGNMEGLLYKGSAKDARDNRPISFFALLVGTPQRSAVVFAEANDDAPKIEAAKLEALLASIQPGAGGGKQQLHAVLAVDKDGKPSTQFTTNPPLIYALVMGDALQRDDKIRSLWIAENVGDGSAKEIKVGESALVAKGPKDNFTFTLSRPADGWIIGTYRVEIYVNDQVATSLAFTIAQP